jgi:hypothetical protein
MEIDVGLDEPAGSTIYLHEWGKDKITMSP